MNSNPSNDDSIQTLADRVIRDAGNGLSALLAATGCKMGLYRSLADASTRNESLTAAALAARCGLVEQYVRDWLASQLAAGYVSLSQSSGSGCPPQFFLSDAQRTVFTQLDHQLCQAARLHCSTAIAANVVQKMEREFREGRGIAWADSHPNVFPALELLRRRDFDAHIRTPLLRAVPAELAARLERDGPEPPVLLLDVACGTGYSVKQFAKIWPKGVFAVGLDTYEPDIAAVSRECSASMPNVSFVCRDAHSVPSPQEIPDLPSKWHSFTQLVSGSGPHPLNSSYDVVTIMDTMHDFAHPVAVLRAVRRVLNRTHGTVVVFEPGTGEPRLDTLGQCCTDAYLAACATAMCGPCALLDRVREGASITSTTGISGEFDPPLSLLSLDEEYFAVARSAGFEKIEKLADRIFVFSG